MSSRHRKRDAGLKRHDHAMSLAEIAQVLGVTRERVRQIETKALTKARRILEKWGYRLEDLVPDGDRPTEVSQPEESQS